MHRACRKATELISRGMDRPLTWRERFSLGIHLVVCNGCRRFRRQAQVLRQAARDAASRLASPSAQLSPEARERIDEVLRRSP